MSFLWYVFKLKHRFFFLFLSLSIHPAYVNEQIVLVSWPPTHQLVMQYYVCTGEIGCLKADCGQILFVHNLGSGGKGDNPYWVRHSGLRAMEWETQQQGKEGIH